MTTFVDPKVDFMKGRVVTHEGAWRGDTLWRRLERGGPRHHLSVMSSAFGLPDFAGPGECLAIQELRRCEFHLAKMTALDATASRIHV
ncbi:hypothetical protein EV130_102216 [Rhizobium azibense]|uniref:Uncharacterized protein n=1 Tax=Rhizobium azibense TaxID=1136135 RepID=A0A4R3RCX3_9HYPH|nr:hypothetical protein EV130_102216 [Rhizobium azibense]TCU31592.1 hypothetical protein EV129_12654 [Rhizobium azibense]